MKDKNIKRINNSISLINTVIKSCKEGKEGTWDCSTDDGKNGFDDMAELLGNVVIVLLAIKKDL